MAALSIASPAMRVARNAKVCIISVFDCICCAVDSPDHVSTGRSGTFGLLPVVESVGATQSEHGDANTGPLIKNHRYVANIDNMRHFVRL